MRGVPAAILSVLAFVSQATAAPVTIAYEAEASTVVGEPFGIEVPRLTVVTGYFTFDTSTPDVDPSDDWGDYPHDHTGAFRADFLGHSVSGSKTPFYQVYDGPSPANDTFRLIDGPRIVGDEGGVMRFDDDPDESIELWLSIVEDVQDNDDLTNVFPLYDFGFLGTTHTFSLENDGGTMLLQFLSATTAVCGDPNGGGPAAGDALVALRAAVDLADCYLCHCDTDGNEDITASDALTVLRFAVGILGSVTCSACL